MTSSPPEEAPHYNGKVTTPESPLPLHIPEPSNIPVLENQIDPIFNLMSTHLDKPASYAHMQSVATSRAPLQQHSMNDVDSHTQATDLAIDTDTTTMNGTAEAINDILPAAIQGQASSHQPNGSFSTPLQQNSLISPVQPSSGHEVSTSATSPSGYDPLISNPTVAETEPNDAFPTTAAIQDPNQSFVASQTQVIKPQTSQSADANGLNSDQQALQPARQQNDSADTDMTDGNAIFQTLLDTLSPTTNTHIGPNPEKTNQSQVHDPSKFDNSVDASEPSAPDSIDNPLSTIPTPAGLPPRPPPQEKPTIHPHYEPNQDISSYHITPAAQSTSHISPVTPAGGTQAGSQFIAETLQDKPAANGLPPPPSLTALQQAPASDEQPSANPQNIRDAQVTGSQSLEDAMPREDNDMEVQWSADVERIWQEFLQAEAIYVSDGTWDRFPQGSRLFVGNLFTEKTNKRDLFFVFHHYGKLAQISIKNAYGFIQFHDTLACSRALQEEQGLAIRGKKIHLEISKPQKNTRGSGTNQRQSNNNNSRRSRSPDQGRRGGRGQNQADRYDGRSQQNTYRQRDDYRPIRSPSPLGGFRGRAHSPPRYNSGRSRSRSPHGRYDNFRPRSPDHDDEASLPIPRRDPRDVPDVQIVILDDVDRAFVGYIDKSFRDRGLISHVYALAPRLSLEAFTKRQILEGVQAVVKLIRQSQITGKIPLQIFDRTDRNNVRFEEYDQLDGHIAAELVVRSKSKRAAQAPTYGVGQYQPPQIPQYPPPAQQPIYPSVPPPQPQQLQSPTGQPNLQNVITSMDGPTLQKLLGAIGQNRPGQQQPDLTAILGAAQHQQVQQQVLPPQQQAFGYAGTSHQQQQHQPVAPPQYAQTSSYVGSPTTPNGFANNPALAQILQNTQQQQQQQQQQGQYQGGGAAQQNVQGIMEQLARYNRQ